MWLRASWPVQVPDRWVEDDEIDLGMAADFVFKSGATGHFSCSFVAGESAGPVTVTARGSAGTMSITNYNGGANRANQIVVSHSRHCFKTADAPSRSLLKRLLK